MYRILCNRSPARELGSGLTWLKEAGQIVEFSTMEEAGVKAKELNKNLTLATVKYSAHKYGSGGDE